jgi:hypothetical protein
MSKKEIKKMIVARFSKCANLDELQRARVEVSTELKAYRDSIRWSKIVAYMDDLAEFCILTIAVMYERFNKFA